MNVSCVIATCVNSDGRREVCGVDSITTEDGAGWTAFLRGLLSRELSGVSLVISDAHPGLKYAIASCLPSASLKRCRTHFARNLLCRIPKASHDLVATCVRTIFAPPDKKSVFGQHAAAVEHLETRSPEAAEMLAEARDDNLAFATYPRAHWLNIWSTGPRKRLNRDVRRRTDVLGIFPNRALVMRLVGAFLAEQHEKWPVCCRYMSLELFAKARMKRIDWNAIEIAEK